MRREHHRGGAAGGTAWSCCVGISPRVSWARDPHGDESVGAEMNALLMALEAIVPGERVAIVADFLWSVYYVLGWWNVNHPALIEQVAAARTLLDAPARVAAVHPLQRTSNDGSASGRWTSAAARD